MSRETKQEIDNCVLRLTLAYMHNAVDNYPEDLSDTDKRLIRLCWQHPAGSDVLDRAAGMMKEQLGEDSEKGGK